MPPLYRPAREEDLEAAQALVVQSINDLTQRHGFGAMASARSTAFESFSLRDDPRSLWVAEEAGEMIGFAFSWVCGDLWFLAELFVSPDHQGRGIGNALLALAEDHAQKSGAQTRALITFAFNTVSQGLYIQHGMFPRLPLFFVGAPRAALAERLQRPYLDHAPIANDPSHLETLAEIDERALGISRAKHHRHLIESGELRGVIFSTDGEPTGYAYTSPSGHIGPVAVARPGLLAAVFATALKLAAEGSSAQVSAFLPGTCEDVFRVAVEHGMRITFPMVLAANRDFGSWTQYLPRNPGFM